ncbi:MAG: lamin tail domain-containing protein, partial [Planctomycetota bacterium]
MYWRIVHGENSTWSALNEATFAVGPVTDNLRITEIMYNPAAPNTEYIELQNIGTGMINLNLVKFTNGIDFTFPNIELPSNEYVIVVQDI